jgi:hypothetical protein
MQEIFVKKGRKWIKESNRAEKLARLRKERRARLRERRLRDIAKSPYRSGPAPGETTTRYDINSYGGGTGHIRHIGVVKKRR